MNTTGEQNPNRRLDTKKFLILMLSALVFIASISYIVYEVMTQEVTVVVDGEEITTVTTANTVEELMSEIEVEVSEHDELSEDLHTSLEEGMVIEYDSAKSVYVTVDHETTEYFTTKETIEQFFAEKNINLHENDDLSVSLDSNITDGMHVAISKAFEVTVNDGGEKRTRMVTNQTVDELLGRMNIKLGDLDKLDVDPKEKVKNHRNINITRVSKEIVTEETSVPYKTETRNDSNLDKGKTKVIQQGQNGKKVLTYEVTKENGEVVSRELVDEEVVESSKNEIIARGTKENIQLISNNESEVLKEFYASATAYTAYCTGCSGVTYTGIDLRSNPNMKVIAVDPSVIPLGSKVWVEGYGYAIAGDTGGAIKGNRIDLHVPTKEEAHRYGRRTVRVKVFKN